MSADKTYTLQSFRTEGYPDDGSGAPYYVEFTATVEQYYADNKSIVKWSAKVGGGRSSGSYNTIFQRYASVGTFYRSSVNDYGDTVANGSVVYSDNTTIYHNSDGTAQFTADIRVSFEVWNSNYNSKKSKTYTLDTIPREAPTISSATVSNTQYVSKVVAGYSRSTLNITASANNTGATISRYVVKYGNSVLYDGSSSTPVVTVPTITSNSASITYSVTVYDSYGLSKSTNCSAFTAYRYVQGSLGTPTTQRCLNDGTLNEEGTYAKCQIPFISSTIGGTAITTTVKVTVNSKTGTATSSPMNVTVGNGTLSTATSYSVVYKLYDAVIGESATNVTSTDVITISFHTMNFSSNGRGVGFGQLGVSGYLDITTMKLRINQHELIDCIYPVGAIFMSVNNVNPGTYLGGTWARITDTFLYAGTDSGTYKVGNTGGSKNSVASHTHPDAVFNMRGNSEGSTYDNIAPVSNVSRTFPGNWNNGLYNSSGSTPYEQVTIKTASEGITDGNMPPWLAVYMWERTA